MSKTVDITRAIDTIIAAQTACDGKLLAELGGTPAEIAAFTQQLRLRYRQELNEGLARVFGRTLVEPPERLQ